MNCVPLEHCQGDVSAFFAAWDSDPSATSPQSCQSHQKVRMAPDTHRYTIRPFDYIKV